jgi:hypothetical protein
MNSPPIIPPGQVLSPMLTAAEQARTAVRNGGTPRKRRRNTRDRFGVLNAFIDCTAGSLSRAEVLSWLILYRDTRNGTARTSHSDIARRAGIGRRNVVRAIGRLVKRGLLIVVYRGGLNRGPSAYRVYPLESVAPCDNSMPAAGVAGVTSAGDISMRSLVTRESHIP